MNAKKDHDSKEPAGVPVESPVIIVGIGASAGGVASTKKLFAGVPAGQRLAFVLVQHLPPSDEHIAVNALKNLTALNVVVADEGMLVRSDHVYVLPPGKHFDLNDGRFLIKPPVHCEGLRLPIDHFFCSLAADRKDRTVGIVLSGMGSDGKMGLSEIKAAGGRTIVEDPESADFADMPANAIAAGVADLVLPAGKIGETLIVLAAEAAAREVSGEDENLGIQFRAVLNILRVRSGHDFRCYKKNTLVRRIRHRMAVNQLKQPADYVKFMETHSEEADLLRKDLLIGVTDFFRQPDAWRMLEEKVIPELIRNMGPEKAVRVWVPGCATGKEAYSMAILLAECVEASGKKIAIQVFATDADEDSLEVARRGTYAEDEIGSGISDARLKKFFVHKKGLYHVAKQIRESVVFAPQNLTSDPPFSKLSLISCRNLLIYLGRDIQRQIINLFHFSLREGGFLFLGNAETVGGQHDLFEIVSKKWRIYRRIGAGRQSRMELPFASVSGAAAFRRVPQPSPHRPTSFSFLAQHVLAARFAPTAIIVDRKQQLLYGHGITENYLVIPGGEATTNVVEMAREGLRTRLGAALRKAIEEDSPITITACVARGDRSVTVKATVTPLHQPREMDGLLLISFEDRQPSPKRSAAPAQSDGDKRDIQHLEEELKVAREELQSTIEQLEGSNEELKSSNEEVMASNEELQSANEELETSKEELQSLNEELNTVNTRLEEKVDELETSNNDVTNLLGSTNIATAFLDRDFKIRRFTPAVTKLLNLIPSDIGRPILDITRKFSDDSLLPDARRVLAELTAAAKEVRADDGRWYIRRITPYRTQDDRIEGVVLTFVDVDELKQTQEAILRAKEEWERTFDSVPDLIAILDDQHHIMRANKAMAERLGLTPAQCVGIPCYKAVHGVDAPPDFCPHAKTMADGLEHTAEVHEDRLSGDFLVSTTPVFSPEGKMTGSVHVARDITEVKRAAEALRQLNSQLEQRVAEQTSEIRLKSAYNRSLIEASLDPLVTIGSDGKITDVNAATEAATGCRKADLIGSDFSRYFTEPEKARAGYEQVFRDGLVRDYPLEICHMDGHATPVMYNATVYRNEAGEIIGAVADARDITEAKKAEALVRTERQRLYDVLETLPAYVVLLSKDYHVPFANKFFRERFGESHGRRCFEYLFQRSAACENCETYKVLKTGKPHHWYWTGPDGRDYDIYDYPFTDADGSAMIMEMGIDITDMKKAQEALKDLNATLERRVAERTAELAASNEELASFNSVAVGRELRMIELKKQINELCAKAGLPAKYEVEFTEEGS